MCTYIILWQFIIIKYKVTMIKITHDVEKHRKQNAKRLANACYLCNFYNIPFDF